jgi:hypothetical protein
MLYLVQGKPVGSFQHFKTYWCKNANSVETVADH